MPVWLFSLVVIAVLGLAGVVVRNSAPGRRSRTSIGPISLWILLPLLGMYTSVRLILDGNYGVLGHG